MYNLANILKETRFYQEAFLEGFREGFREGRREARKEIAERLFFHGYSIENILQLLTISVDEVQEFLQVSNEAEI